MYVGGSGRTLWQDFEPGGGARRMGGRRRERGGIGRGDVAVRSTDHRRGNPFVTLTTDPREHFVSARRVHYDSLFIVSRGTIFLQSWLVRYT